MLWLLFVTVILVSVLGLLLFSLISLIIASMAGAPFVPARADRIKTLVSMVPIRPGTRIADLGSGDGRVVRALAQQGAVVDGYEIQPLLVWWSRWLSGIRRMPATRYYRKNLFRVDLNQYDMVIIYGLPTMMTRLGHKFAAELRPGCWVVSIAFPIPEWTPTISRNGVHVYEIKAKGKSPKRKIRR